MTPTSKNFLYLWGLTTMWSIKSLWWKVLNILSRKFEYLTPVTLTYDLLIPLSIRTFCSLGSNTMWSVKYLYCMVLKILSKMILHILPLWHSPTDPSKNRSLLLMGPTTMWSIKLLWRMIVKKKSKNAFYINLTLWPWSLTYCPQYQKVPSTRWDQTPCEVSSL